MRKRLLQSLGMAVVPFIGFLIIRFVYLTSKKTFHLPDTIPEEPFIVAMWHGDLLMQGLHYKKLRPQMRLKAIISEHTDGQLIAKTFEYLGVGSVRGSTRRGGAKVLIQAISMLKKGFDVAVTPDGPKGPRHTVHNGIVVMAQKTGAKVIFLQCKPSKQWQLKSWDRFTIPKPFGHLEFFASEPIDLSGMDLEEAKSLVKMKLMENHPDGDAT
ncbi:MAG: lysophospholipid acyltransferase family protein [Sulfurimonadaceae bacterium]|nr:lysophospholipid acyltransferase family protein [Sulfurimonadaceae bacterium]